MINKLNETIKNLKHGWNCPLTQEERELLHKLKDCTVSERVINYYKNNIKNNQDDSSELCKKKLIRNIILAKQAPIKEERPERMMFYFGNLSLLWMSDINEIVWIDNKIGSYPIYIDKTKKSWLNEELGIEENITYGTVKLHNGSEIRPIPHRENTVRSAIKEFVYEP